MPADSPDDVKARLERINADLDYYRKAVQGMGVGHQPPTIYASKYVEDMEFLMGLAVHPSANEVLEPPKSELEKALADDAAGRVERKTKRT